jgi:hypothetical protein
MSSKNFKILFILGLVTSFFVASPTLAAVSFTGLLYTSAPSFKMTGFAFTAFNLNIVGACERIRKEAEELAGENYAFNMGRKNGALDAITSPDNGSPLETKFVSYDEKIAKLVVFYDQRTKPCQITHDCYRSVCDTGTTPARKSFNFELDDCIKTPVREYTNDDMVALCKDTRKFMMERGFNDLRAAREYFSEQIMAYLVTQIGINHQFSGGDVAASTYKTLDLIGADSASQPIPLPGNFATMPLDYENNQLTGKPIVIGQGNFELFWKLHGMSCCNATTPYGDENLDGDVAFYKDQAANRVFGNNKVLMLAPGAIKLVTFNENRNIEKMGTNTNQNMSITVPDPAGYPFDWNLDLYWDICDKKWKMMYSISWGIFNLFQLDSFSSNSETTGSPDCSDELDNMLGVFGYSIT